MNLDVLNKRLVIVVGKGGVGKSTVCSALSVLASRAGKRVLIIEVSSKGKISSMFGLPDSGYQTQHLFQNIYSITINPEEALREYGMIRLKYKRAYNIVFENEFMKALIRVIPGINELLLLGKVAFEEQQIEKDGKYKWDMIILDAPPTGQGLSLLKFPSTVLEVIPEGPMAVEMKNIKKLLLDENRTCINIVTLPEEMPVMESIELKKEIDHYLQIPLGYLIINGLIEEFFESNEKKLLAKLSSQINDKDDGTHNLLRATLFLTKRREMQEEYLAKILTFFNEMRKIVVPLVPLTGDKFLQIEKISYYLERRIVKG